MKIAVVAPSPIPFDPGGAEAVWAGLYRELAGNSPHDVELIKIPIRERLLPEVMAAYEAFAGLDLTHFDLVISGKYPAWMVSHPHHVVYLLHPLRGLYDSYAAFGLPLVEAAPEPAVRRLLAAAGGLRTAAQLPEFFGLWRASVAELGADHPALRHPGPVGRTVVRALDAVALAPGAVRRHFAISRTVAQRPDYFPPGVAATVLYPPSDLQGLHQQSGEFFFTASRHDPPKRLDLLIAAMARYSGSAQLVIGGRGPESAALEELARPDPRIRFVGRLSPADLVDHYARAIGVPFLPLNEDLGLVTIEAMSAGKPVLTTHDAGGPTEFVLPGRNGVITDATPAALGAGLSALERLAALPTTADAARRAVKDISWKRVATELVGSPIGRVRRPRLLDGSNRRRLVVTSTFPIWPARGGGQLRAIHLYGALARRFDIDLLCLGDPFTAPTVRQLAPGMTEYVVPRSADHHAEEAALSAAAAMPVTDIVSGRLIERTPDYLGLLRASLSGAAGVLLAHPFLHPAVRLLHSDLPVVYDAHNCEYLLKSQLLPGNAAGAELAAEVFETERAACADAELILTVSAEDSASLRRLYGSSADRMLVVPNGVDLDAVPFTPMAVRRQHRDRWLASFQASGQGAGITRLAVFVGSWHPPNNEAGRAIAAMADKLPHVGFLLVGSHCRTLEHLRLPPNVVLLGVVSDAGKQTVLRSADVALAPLTSGSGTNLKVVEYLAAGIPLVSTPIGMRGLDFDPALVRLAEVADFPAAIDAELRRNEDVAGRAELARASVERSYGWPALGQLATDRIAQVVRPAQSALRNRAGGTVAGVPTAAARLPAQAAGYARK